MACGVLDKQMINFHLYFDIFSFKQLFLQFFLGSTPTTTQSPKEEKIKTGLQFNILNTL